MIKKFFLCLIFLCLFFMGGCVLADQFQPEKPKTFIPVSTTYPTEETIPMPNSELAIATLLPTLTSTPLPVTVTPEVLHTPSLVPTVALISKCSIFEPVSIDENSLLRGLVFSLTWNGDDVTGILGHKGFQSPALILNDPEMYGIAHISPNREWLAYFAVINENETMITLKVKLINPMTLEENEHFFESQLPIVSLGNWVNDTTFEVLTRTEGERYEWTLWEPFTDQVRTLTLDMVGMGNAIDIFHIKPILDPSLSLVVYPCDRHQCGGAEYQVKSLINGESLWTVDFDASHPLRNQPMWSPDGQYLAIIISEKFDLNHLLRIYDRKGNLVYELAFPRAGIGLSWSPDNQHLAFFRTVPDPVNEVIRVLTYLDLRDGGIYDLCLTDSAGAYPIVWSPDGNKLAINAQLEYTENSPALLSIVDIGTGEILQVYQPDWHVLMGWIKPIEK